MYLGSVITETGDLNPEIQNRVYRASVAFSRLRNRVFSNHHLITHTKGPVYRTICLSTLLYASETWTPYCREIQTLESFHMKNLRRIIGKPLKDHIPCITIL